MPVQQPFSCRRGTLTIRGSVVLPDTPGKHPAVILSHGFMGIHQHMLGYAHELAQLGYISFAYDFCGGGMQSASDGATTEMSVLTEKQDLLAVMDAVLAREDVDPEHLYLMGASQGGFVSALTAAERGAQVAALILIFPALCIPDDAQHGALMMSSYDPANPPEVIHCGPMPVGRIYHDDVVGIDPFAAIAPYKGPVLILHGTCDRVVAYDYARRALEAYGTDHCQLIPLEGADHGFNAEQNVVAMGCVKLFLKGQQELLRIPVEITHVETLVPGENGRVAVYFNAKCDSPLFRGKTTQEGVDTQDLEGGKAVKLNAVYTLTGTDCAGDSCSISIVNTNVNGEWKPKVRTDTKALSFMNSADLTAILQFLPKGPIVHIFGEPARAKSDPIL